jgi:hypothetical protein
MSGGDTAGLGVEAERDKNGVRTEKQGMIAATLKTQEQDVPEQEPVIWSARGHASTEDVGNVDLMKPIARRPARPSLPSNIGPKGAVRSSARFLNLCYFLPITEDILIPDEQNPLILDKPRTDERSTVFLRFAVAGEQLVRDLEGGVSIDQWLDAFPSVTREQAIAVLEYARSRMLEPVAWRFHLTQCVPRRLRKSLPGHDIKTTQEMGWDRLRNGDLIQMPEQGFDALITSDQNLKYQQNLSTRKLGVVTICPATRPQNCSCLVGNISGETCRDSALKRFVWTTDLGTGDHLESTPIFRFPPTQNVDSFLDLAERWKWHSVVI